MAESDRDYVNNHLEVGMLMALTTLTSLEFNKSSTLRLTLFNRYFPFMYMAKGHGPYIGKQLILMCLPVEVYTQKFTHQPGRLGQKTKASYYHYEHEPNLQKMIK